MKIRLLYHAVRSDWNNGNAHFLRGIATELAARDHDVVILEPADNWSTRSLLADEGPAALDGFAAQFPLLRVETYAGIAAVDAWVRDADLVIAHEWSEVALLQRLVRLRAEHGFVLFYHDTHHRLITDREKVAAINFAGFDAVLAYGDVLAAAYRREGLTDRAWTWHEAADTRVFTPRASDVCEGELVWIGNWGDDEREAELHEFLIDPVRALGLRARVYGVRYPERALRALARAGIVYGGWLPNAEAPRVFARHRVTVHVPRGPYARQLPGIPTIRPFEAMACGIPLISAPWEDREGLFRAGTDHLVARDGPDMRAKLHMLLAEPQARAALAREGLATIRARHTCAHRVDELIEFHGRACGRRPVSRGAGAPVRLHSPTDTGHVVAAGAQIES